MNRMGKNVPSMVIEKVKVTAPLSLEPVTDSIFSPILACVDLLAGTYFEGIWSKMIISDGGVPFCFIF